MRNCGWRGPLTGAGRADSRERCRDLPGMKSNRTDQASTGLGEPLAVWVLFAVVALEIFITESRVPAAELYNPVSSGVSEGAYGALAFLGYAGALAALGVLPILYERWRA